MEYQSPIRDLLFIDSANPEIIFALRPRFSTKAMQIEPGGPITKVPLVKAHYVLVSMFGGKGIYAFDGVTVE